MKVLLIYPRFRYERLKKQSQEQQEPLGILYIASCLRVSGHDVSLLDLTFDKDLSRLREVRNADVVGISATTSMFDAARLVLACVKRINPGVPCVLGGPHATVLPMESLNAGFDYVVVGEGERTIVELVSALERKSIDDIEGIAGVVGKKDGKIWSCMHREPIANLDTIPFPSRDLIDYDKYSKFGPFAFGIIASRGCPYNCLFCQPTLRKLFGKRVRQRSAVNVVDEIEEIQHQYKLSEVPLVFRDDTLGALGPEWFRAFCHELAIRRIRTRWKCQLRVNEISRELLELMHKSGCSTVQFGVESGSQRILNFYRKGITVDQTIRAFDMCHQLGLRTYAFLMLGAPEEKEEDLQLTLDLVRRIVPDDVGICITTPVPGTDLYDLAMRKGIYNIRHWVESDYYITKTPMKLAHLSQKDLNKYATRIRRTVYERNLIATLRKAQLRSVSATALEGAFYFLKYIGWADTVRQIMAGNKVSNKIFRFFEMH